MESQNTLAEVSRHNTTNEMNSALLDEALTLLSRLLGRQAALDFVRNPDILIEGDAE
ncbi:hypothetical protein SLH49_00810 [Cognatiyoonia sp. IB215446]|uniref:hypothetical protein n=1 Tax=Cognatiyoonia sp. IB215446 TaxID=3097355 RepID=UPI002A16DA8B|nr:hypothetical protein [Cognatiyoonia sp. IB215446]MDX8346509.1 hypothetical protein [Cognatiyoonia sp. IB215446]